MKAIKIKMKPLFGYSNSIAEIDEIFLIGISPEGYYKKEIVYDILKQNKNSIQVNIPPYPNLIPSISVNGKKYVRSFNDSYKNDNLINLPKS